MNRFRDILLGASLTALLLVALLPRHAAATYNPIQLLKSPAAPLSLTHNVVTTIPGVYCSVMVRNHAANPVYFGGPKVNGSVVSGVTVNTSGSQAVCTDTAACEGDLLTINVMTGGIALLSTIDTTVTVTLGEGCQP